MYHVHFYVLSNKVPPKKERERERDRESEIAMGGEEGYLQALVVF